MKRLTAIAQILAIGLPLALGSTAALADPHGGPHGEYGWRGEGRPWHGGEIRHFHERDFGAWRGGAWQRGWHGDRYGWWWVVGGIWYFYPRPVYPYPDPYVPPVVVETPVPAPQPQVVVPPPAQYWYYCDQAGGYYPYVPSCPGGWRQVPAEPVN